MIPCRLTVLRNINQIVVKGKGFRGAAQRGSVLPMIISHGRRYIFVHIPKTGGTAMALALESRAKKDDMMLGDTPKAVNRRRRLRDVQARGRLWKHATLADIDGLVTPAQMDGYFCFTLVRNPWDRMVSYYHWLRAQGFDHPAVRLAQELDFSPFLNHPVTVASLRAAPPPHYMTDAAGQVRCNCYIRLEHFAEDSADLRAHLGFDVALDRINASDRGRDYRAYYGESDSQLVAEICGFEVNALGYTFEQG